MKRSMHATALCVGLAAASTGCGPANPLIGKWQMTQNMMGTQITVTREFRSDGTETLTGGLGAMSTDIRYSVDGDKLTESVTSMTIGGNTMRIDASKLPANAPKSMTETFSVNGDKLTLGSSATGVQVTQTFDRVKEQ